MELKFCADKGAFCGAFEKQGTGVKPLIKSDLCNGNHPQYNGGKC
jgi:hypothetical protein